ncbi:zinc-binding alcohol dehydrogenase family protein [Burkholderia glumae]|uniref:Zinc-binding alcohol dehydrogenase family protein n=1 Tax=Burkholderia glumae TaxID=337 RepID=A0AAP9XVP7_BURGL|nr:zinc-binding alcohol dehydrogenase family protein [Burkholderia glumae]ACR32178.1 Alcohol dehydrogenase GroES-like protein [Burkholderia glumae BGR1]AJY64793.1 zinc-binding dehydrogenase family protein [Burkholderia glumae LMG 2196 = ATCC 33617]KHJ63883.1 dehydrogenase [Burkholderia glumae]MCM2484638.1 zinc-binding alcohol dehydrogenase family protein [Burkholderia glumae]MCM2495019.1 zinc-binding alcohol dehydrogenase family protein [Burkholderia glumae]
MLSVICEAPGVLRALQRDLPVRGSGEILLRVSRVGICGTDLHIFTGNQPYLEYPRVMGHELSAVVVEAEADSGFEAGDGVYVMPYLSCGHCVACRQGKTNCCVDIKVLGVHRDGAFTEYLSVPAQFVHKAEGVSLDQAAMLEFLAIGAHAVRRAEVQPGQRVLVVGAGPIGMAAMIFAQLRGGTVTCLDTRADRLAFCRSQLGIAATVPVGEGDAAQLAALTNGEFFDVVFDATGNIDAMNRGFAFVAHGGRYVLISIVPGQVTFSDPEFHKREMTLLASRNATAVDFDTVLAAMRDGHIPDQALNTHRMRLADVPEALPRLLEPGQTVVKALVEC